MDYISLLVGPSQVIIAIANVILVFIAISSLRQNRKVYFETIQVQQKNVKVLLFIELFIKPNIEYINKFNKKLENKLKQKINNNENLNNERILHLAKVIKDETKLFRNDCYQINGISPQLYNKIKVQIEEITDILTVNIDNCENKLHNPIIFQEHISQPIIKSKSKIIQILFDYKGD